MFLCVTLEIIGYKIPNETMLRTAGTESERVRGHGGGFE